MDNEDTCMTFNIRVINVRMPIANREYPAKYEFKHVLPVEQNPMIKATMLAMKNALYILAYQAATIYKTDFLFQHSPNIS